MKKTVVFVWLLAYVALTAGISVNYHYCMNKLDSARLFKGERKVCDKCGMHTAASKGCCRDEIYLVKVDDDQQPVAVATYDFSLPDVLLTPSSVFLNAPQERVLTVAQADLPPPLLGQVDPCIINCVFRI